MGDLKCLPTGSLAIEAFGNAVNVTVVELILRSLLPGSARERNRSTPYLRLSQLLPQKCLWLRSNIMFPDPNDLPSCELQRIF